MYTRLYLDVHFRRCVANACWTGNPSKQHNETWGLNDSRFLWFWFALNHSLVGHCLLEWTSQRFRAHYQKTWQKASAEHHAFSQMKSFQFIFIKADLKKKMSTIITLMFWIYFFLKFEGNWRYKMFFALRANLQASYPWFWAHFEKSSFDRSFGLASAMQILTEVVLDLLSTMVYNMFEKFIQHIEDPTYPANFWSVKDFLVIFLLVVRRFHASFFLVQIQQAESDHPSIFPAAGRDGIFTFLHPGDACANCAST